MGGSELYGLGIVRERVSSPQKIKVPVQKMEKSGCGVGKNKEDVHDIRKHSYCLSGTFLTGFATRDLGGGK